MRKPSDTLVDTGYAWWLLGVGLILSSVSFVAVTSLPILLIPISMDLPFTRAALSMSHTLAMLGAGLSGLVLGRMVDRFGFFWMSVVGGLAIGAGLLLVSQAQTLVQLYTAYGLLIGGVGQGVFFGPITATVSRWFQRRRSFAMAVVLSGQSIGGLIGPVLLRELALSYGWRRALAGYGISAMIVTIIGSLAFRPNPPPNRELPLPVRMPSDVGRQDKCVNAIALIVLTLCTGNAAVFIFVAHVTAFGEELGIQPKWAAAVLSALLGASLLSRLLSGLATDRIGGFRVLVLSTSVLVLGSALMLFVSSFGAIIAAASIIGLGYGAFIPSLTSIVREQVPAERAGAEISFVFFFAFLAAAVGGVGGGYLHDVVGDYYLGFKVALCANLWSAAFAVALSKSQRKAIRKKS